MIVKFNIKNNRLFKDSVTMPTQVDYDNNFKGQNQQDNINKKHVLLVPLVVNEAIMNKKV